jgi:hypothetical protein
LNESVRRTHGKKNSKRRYLKLTKRGRSNFARLERPIAENLINGVRGARYGCTVI